MWQNRKVQREYSNSRISSNTGAKRRVMKNIFSPKWSFDIRVNDGKDVDINPDFVEIVEIDEQLDEGGWLYLSKEDIPAFCEFLMQFAPKDKKGGG